MSRLLSANFVRMRKSKTFWICLLFMFLYGAYVYISDYFEIQRTGYIETVDAYFFNYAIFVGILIAVFCSLFIGTEYSDGTLRNKLIVGHTKPAIYLSNLIVCSVVGLLMCIAYIVPACLFGIPLLGFFDTDPKVIVLFVACSFLMSLAFTSIATLLCMLNQNKAVSAVVNILFVLVLLFFASHINARLDEPERTSVYVYSVDDGESSALQTQENPLYLSGTRRKFFEFLLDLLPTGQAIQLISLSADHPLRWPFCSLGILFVTTGFGIFFFKRKDLK